MTLDEALAKLRLLKPQFPEMNIRRMAVFGSVVRNEAQPGSDLDILVDVRQRPFTLLDMERTRNRLSDYMGVPVDLRTFGGLSRSRHANILEEAVDV